MGSAPTADKKQGVLSRDCVGLNDKNVVPHPSKEGEDMTEYSYKTRPSKPSIFLLNVSVAFTALDFLAESNNQEEFEAALETFSELEKDNIILLLASAVRNNDIDISTTLMVENFRDFLQSDVKAMMFQT